MCTADEYLARVRQLPIHYDRPTADGEAWLYRDDKGEPVRVAKPEYLGTDAKRAAAIELLEIFCKPSRH